MREWSVLDDNSQGSQAKKVEVETRIGYVAIEHPLKHRGRGYQDRQFRGYVRFRGWLGGLFRGAARASFASAGV